MTEIHARGTGLPPMEAKDIKDSIKIKFIIPEIVPRLLPVCTLLSAFAFWAINGKIPEVIDEGRAVSDGSYILVFFFTPASRLQFIN